MDQLPTPEAINILGFAKRFARQHLQQANRPFLFVLGSGASASSGIRTGGQLVREWLEQLYHEALGRGGRSFDAWLRDTKAGIEGFDPDDPAASYSKVFEKVYKDQVDAGHAFLEMEMSNKRPSYGYALLAQILAKTQHRIVVTTNFDNLVADALLLCSDTYPLVCGHEVLAGYASVAPRRPLVIKVHRDVLLGPRNTTEEISALATSWRQPLLDLFSRQTPIVIGYGGNDGSLMGLLKEIPPDQHRTGIYWCFREVEGLPRREILDLISHLHGRLVPISDFDTLLFLLASEMGEIERDPHQIVQSKATAHVEELEASRARIGKAAEAIYREPTPDSDHLVSFVLTGPPPTSDAAETSRVVLTEIAATSAQREPSKSWWDWLAEIRDVQDPEAQLALYEVALEALPESPELLSSFASFLSIKRKDYDRAEAFYQRALAADPKDERTLGLYATFLATVRKDLDGAEKLFIQALDANPHDAYNLGRFARFLANERRDSDRAEAVFSQAITAHPRDVYNLVSFANFLAETRKDPSGAAEIYRRVLEIDPKNALARKTLAARGGRRP